MPFFLWCRRPESNRHGLRHCPLKTACLPIPPRRRIFSYTRHIRVLPPEAHLPRPTAALLLIVMELALARWFERLHSLLRALALHFIRIHNPFSPYPGSRMTGSKKSRPEHGVYASPYSFSGTFSGTAVSASAGGTGGMSVVAAGDGDSSTTGATGIADVSTGGSGASIGADTLSINPSG